MAEENEKQFVIQKLYIKDVSFETPNSPEIFMQEWAPKVEFNLANNAKNLQENVFEVGLTLTVTVKLEDKTAYLVEICQAGVFTLNGFDEKELNSLLGSYCPDVLFPYAREAVSSLVVKGGFPPLLLSPVNFEALYMQQLQQSQQTPPPSRMN